MSGKKRPPYLDLEPHPLACLFDLDEEGIPNLAQRIRDHGQRDPIVLFEGKILDGRRRLRACIAANATPVFRQFSPETEGDPLDFVTCKNVHRRHDTPEQRRNLVIAHLQKRPLSSDHALGTICRVAPQFVKDIRAELEEQGVLKIQHERVDTKGRVYETTSPPGAKKKTPVAAQAPSAPPVKIQPPPDAGDAWEEPEPESIQAQEDDAVVQANTAIRDCQGTIVPAHLADVFADTFYASSIDMLDRMMRRINGDTRMYYRIKVKDHFSQSVHHIRGVLCHDAPHSVCTVCQGNTALPKAPPCHHCFSTGWISHGQYLDQMQAIDEGNAEGEAVA